MTIAVRYVLASAIAAALVFTTTPAIAQQQIKIGFVSTLSGPAGGIGKHMKDGADLALDHLGQKMAGVPVEMFYGDDQVRPDVGVQVVEEMLKKHQVDLIAGVIWSHVMMAVLPVVTGAGKILVGTNAGPSPIAGKMCNKLFFSTSWNNDETPEAMGKFLQDSGVDDLYVMAPNYQAGKDMVVGLKRFYKRRIVEEIYTKVNQLDYQAEISQLRAKNPKAVFIFYPGGMGIQFVKQYAQSGLRDKIPLYSVFTVDETTLSALGDAAIGQFETRFWSPDLKVPASLKFVADFKKKFNYTPSAFSAQAYDGMMLIDSAMRAVKGNVKDTQAMVAALAKADFDSVRGRFKFNVNHIPIQNFYLLKAEKGAAGEVEMRIQKTVFEKHLDAYYKECKM